MLAQRKDPLGNFMDINELDNKPWTQEMRTEEVRIMDNMIMTMVISNRLSTANKNTLKAYYDPNPVAR